MQEEESTNVSAERAAESVTTIVHKGSTLVEGLDPKQNCVEYETIDTDKRLKMATSDSTQFGDEMDAYRPENYEALNPYDLS